MTQWLFLASLHKAVNLSHFICANVSQADAGTHVLLVSADPRQDNVTVTDSEDVATLRTVFNQHALIRLEAQPISQEIVLDDPLPEPDDTVVVTGGDAIAPKPSEAPADPQPADEPAVDPEPPPEPESEAAAKPVSKPAPANGNPFA